MSSEDKTFLDGWRNALDLGAIFGFRYLDRVFDAARKAQVLETGARVAGHEFGRPVAYFKFRSNQAWTVVDSR